MLFSWVAGMVMMSLELTGRLPFTEVYIYDKSSKQLQEGFKSSNEHYQGDISTCRADALRLAICELAVQGYLN